MKRPSATFYRRFLLVGLSLTVLFGSIIYYLEMQTLKRIQSSDDLPAAAENDRYLELEQRDRAENNYALEFDGKDQHVRVEDSDSLDINQMTLAAWIRPKQYPSVYASIISKEKSWQLVILNNGSIGYSVETLSESFLQVKSLGGNIPLLTWSFVAVQYDGSTIISFINRAPRVSAHSGSGPIIPSDLPMGIAARYSGGEWSNFFNGTIDEVEVWSRVLSIAEVERQYEKQDYELRARKSIIEAKPGDTFTNTIDLTVIKGRPRNVRIAVFDLPPNSSSILSRESCFLPCSTDLTIITSEDTPIGGYTITVSSNPSTTFNLLIQNPVLGGALPPALEVPEIEIPETLINEISSRSFVNTALILFAVSIVATGLILIYRDQMGRN